MLAAARIAGYFFAVLSFLYNRCLLFIYFLLPNSVAGIKCGLMNAVSYLEVVLILCV